MVGLVPAGAANNRSRRLPANTRPPRPRVPPEPDRRSILSLTRIRVRQVHRTASASQRSAALPVRDPGRGRDPSFVPGGLAGTGNGSASAGLLLREERKTKYSSFPAEHGQHPIGGNGGERFSHLEVVGELRPGRLLPLRTGRPAGPSPTSVPEFPDEVGVLGQPFDENGARPVQGGRDILDPPVPGDEGNRGQGRIRWSGRRATCRPTAPVPPPLRSAPGAPSRFVREIDVLQLALESASRIAAANVLIQFSLRLDGLQHR